MADSPRAPEHVAQSECTSRRDARRLNARTKRLKDGELAREISGRTTLGMNSDETGPPTEGQTWEPDTGEADKIVHHDIRFQIRTVTEPAICGGCTSLETKVEKVGNDSAQIRPLSG